MALSTEAAESKETSCSPLRPPNRTPTLSFFIWNTLAFSIQLSAISGQQSAVSNSAVSNSAKDLTAKDAKNRKGIQKIIFSFLLFSLRPLRPLRFKSLADS
jgi:hypothetical protein